MIAPASQPEIVHLVAAPGAPASPCRAGREIPALLCAQAISQHLTPPGRVVLVGDPASAAHARALGLRVDQRLTPPMGRVELLARQFRALTETASRVVCWSDELAGLLRRCQPECDLISTNPNLAPAKVSKRVQVRVFERSDRDLWDARNHSAQLDSVLAPIVDDLTLANPSITRKSMGIADDAVCLGVVADRPGDIDAREVCFLLGLLNASGYTLTGVVPANASHLAAARRHHRGLGERFRLLIAHEPIITMLPAFDAVIHPCFDGSGASMLLERLCDNADTPVLRLRHSGRAGLSRAPGVAGPIIDHLDELLGSRASEPAANDAPKEPAHA